MSSFTKPVIELIDGEDNAMLKSEMIYCVGAEGSEKKILVPPGFIFDGASIPRIFWTLIGHPLQAEYRQAACLHDWLYATEYYSWAGVTYKRLMKASENRKECDWVFLEALEILGLSWIKRNIIWGAVRCAGSNVWDTHTEITKQEHKQLYYDYIKYRGTNIP